MKLGTITLNGPEGSNLLGFLCALGTFATFRRQWPRLPLRLHWIQDSGWNPVLAGIPECVAAKPERIGSVLHQSLLLRRLQEHFDLPTGDAKPYLNPDKVLAQDYRSFAARSELGDPKNPRSFLDFLASFGCDTETGEGATVKATPLCVLGSSQQYFFKMMRELSQEPVAEVLDKNGKVANQPALAKDPATQVAHIQEALLGPWQYRDDSPTLKLDSGEDRRHALRRLNPTDNRAPIRTVRGANRLAIEALSLFPCAPSAHGVQTAGFTRIERQTVMSWPVWSTPLSLDAVKTLLNHAELTHEEPRRSVLEPLGVTSVFRAVRMQQDKGKASFSISTSVLA
jgi:hypothetical protein